MVQPCFTISSQYKIKVCFVAILFLQLHQQVKLQVTNAIKIAIALQITVIWKSEPADQEFNSEVNVLEILIVQLELIATANLLNARLFFLKMPLALLILIHYSLACVDTEECAITQLVPDYSLFQMDTMFLILETST